MHRTLEQQRAKNALDKVKKLELAVQENEITKQYADQYADYVVRVVSDIRINGLGQAMAQLLAAAKGEQAEQQRKDQPQSEYPDPHVLVYRNIKDWLCRDHPAAPYRGKKDLLEAIMEHDRYTYQWAIAETMAWLEWHKKLAVAYLKLSEGEKES